MKTTVEYRGLVLDIDYYYSHDPGVWTYANGDPGYPAYTECEIRTIKIGNQDASEFFMEYLETEGMFDEILELIIKQHESTIND